MLAAPQSTTLLVVLKAYLSSDHISAATGKTVAITISKNGAAFGNPNAGATNATEIASGWYKVTLDTTDTNTVGPLVVRGTAASTDDVEVVYYVVKATNGGLTALPDTACTTNASLVTAGTGTSQISVSSGQVILQAGTGTGQLDFTSGVVKANATQINAVSTSSVTTVSANVGTTQPINFTGTGASALAKSDMVDVAGAAVSTSTAQLGVNAVQAGGTAWGSGAITAASIATDAITAAKVADGTIDRATFAADTGLQSARSNTAQSGGATSITLDASASATTDFYVGAWIVLTGGTGVGQARVCTAYNGTSKAATVAPAWATNPDVTSTFAVMMAANVSGVQGNVTGSVASVTGAVGSVTGAVGSVTGNVGGNVVGSVASVTGNVTGSVGSVAAGGIAAASFAAGAIDATAIASNAIAAAKIASGAITSAKFAAGAIDAAAIATDAIDADALATDAVTEIQSGLATAAALSTVSGYIDTEVAAIKAKTDNLPASPASTTNITAGTITTVTNLTNLPTAALSELGADPGATPTLAQLLMLIYMKVRNEETQTATTATIKNNAGTTVFTFTTSDNGTTFTKAKMV